MGTKRVAIRRPFKAKVTPEVLELWRRLREIEAEPVAREEWGAGRPAPRNLDAEKRLYTCLGLWSGLGISPLDTRDGYMLHNPIEVEGWRKAW